MGEEDKNIAGAEPHFALCIGHQRLHNSEDNASFREPVDRAVRPPDVREDIPALDVERIVRLVARRTAAADVLLVEGAGGLLVPLAGRTTWLELAARCRLPVLIVAANRLGAINHCALTARVANTAGLLVRGFVLSQTSAAPDASAATNAEVIAGLTGLPCLGSFDHRVGPGEAAPALALDALV